MIFLLTKFWPGQSLAIFLLDFKRRVRYPLCFHMNLKTAKLAICREK